MEQDKAKERAASGEAEPSPLDDLGVRIMDQDVLEKKVAAQVVM